MLSGFSFQLFGYLNIWNQSQMRQCSIRRWKFKHHLSDCFNKRLAFNITYCSAYFYNCNISAFCTLFNPSFDFICNMRNNLNCPSEVIAPPFILYDFFVNLSSSKIIFFSCLKTNKSFVMPKI